MPPASRRPTAATSEGGRVRYQLRDSASCYRHHPDGLVELVVWRRVNQAEGLWRELVFAGPTVAAVEAAYRRHSSEAGDVSQARAERRARWGPRELAT